MNIRRTTVITVSKNRHYKNANFIYSYNINHNNTKSYIDLWLWHKRLGHINIKPLYKLLFKNSKNNSFNINKEDLYKIKTCEICYKAKFTNKVNKKPNNPNKPLEFLDKIYTDIWGPIKVPTYNKYRYFITFLDKKSRYLEVFLIRNKAEALDKFKIYKNRIENNNKGYKIKEVSSDNAKEYKLVLHKYCLIKGIKYSNTPGYTKESNGIIEIINKTLLNKARALLFNANLPLYLWGEAILFSVFLYNITPHSSLKFKSPLEIKDNYNINIQDLNIRVFGSIVYYKNKLIKHKLDTKAYKGVLIGNIANNIYKIWDFNKKKVSISRDIVILEGKYYNDFINLKPEKAIIYNKEEEPINIKDSNIEDPISPNKTGNSSITIQIPKKPDEFYKDYQYLTPIESYNINAYKEVLNNINNNIEPKAFKNAIIDTNNIK